MAYCYDYPRPSLTVDCFIYCGEKHKAFLLLIQRASPPFEHQWALPGGFVDMNELLVQAATRELEEETGLSGIELQQLKVFDKLDRDPRGRTISIVFYGYAGTKKSAVKGISDAMKAEWFYIEELPPLAFDHMEIVDYARKVLNL